MRRAIKKTYMTSTYNTYPANAQVRIQFEDEKETSVTYDVQNLTGDYFDCECDLSTYWDYTDIDSIQQWWKNNEGDEDALTLSEEQEEYIKEAIMHAIRMTINTEALTEDCENCSE